MILHRDERRLFMTIAPHSLTQVLDLYERGLYLQAYTLAQSLGPLEQWEGTDAQVLAGRLAVQLGGRRLQKRLHRRGGGGGGGTARDPAPTAALPALAKGGAVRPR